MSGAAGIAAAKNRRSKPDPNKAPIISCSSKTGSCPVPSGNQQIKNQSNKKVISPNDIAENNLQITTPMHFMQVIALHEQRLNKIDTRLNQVQTQDILPQSVQFNLSEKQVFVPEACVAEACVPQACDAECYDRINTLEEKVQMLEEVIMNLQLTLTNVQSFAMETSLAMLKIQNQTQPTTPIAIPSVTVDDSTADQN
jgi:hypothetical protein